ncbi:hypothetical protein [uncultured Flavobacterium sp.]|uniref:hypothetical protein n=1 Tax=uncultured Flavobacterium sp. TaxID=165435 RepID=UPI0025DD73CE|nr:hypothetical protein [uncultured Flavobacterium sp.]
MSKTVKALLYNFLAFLPFFLSLSYLIQEFTGLTGFWIPITAAVATTLLAPKFQAIKVQGQDKIFMKWLFVKGVREVK